MLLHISEDHSNAIGHQLPARHVRADPGVPAAPTADTFGCDEPPEDQHHAQLRRAGLHRAHRRGAHRAEHPVRRRGAVQRRHGACPPPSAVFRSVSPSASKTSTPASSSTAGEHELQGVEALQFLRTRHGVGDGSDLTRINNQQVFLSSLVRTVKSADTLSRPAQAVLAGQGRHWQHDAVDRACTTSDTMVSIAMALKDIPLDDIVFVQYPTGGTEGGVEPLAARLRRLFAAIAADQPLKLSGAMGRGATLDPNAPAAAVGRGGCRRLPTPRAPADRVRRLTRPPTPRRRLTLSDRATVRPRANTPVPSGARSTTSSAFGASVQLAPRRWSKGCHGFGYDYKRVFAPASTQEPSHSSA